MRETTRHPVTPGSHRSSRAPCDPMNHQQHDPDEEQHPRNLHRDHRNPGEIQCAGDQTDDQPALFMTVRREIAKPRRETSARSPEVPKRTRAVR